MGCIRALELTFWLQTKQPLRENPETEMQMLAAEHPQEQRGKSQERSWDVAHGLPNHVQVNEQCAHLANRTHATLT